MVRNSPQTLIQVKDLLEEKALLYNQPSFISTDPIAIPHRFTRKEDREISGLLAAIIAWGNRKSIIKSGLRIMECLDHAPYDFVMHFGEGDLKNIRGFVHRTFNTQDFGCFLYALKYIYQEHGGLESVFYTGLHRGHSLKDGIAHFRNVFFLVPHPTRTRKHLSNPLAGSAAKRLNMYLRWMVRNDDKGVDFGIWKSISPAELYCPLDIHSGRVARRLGLLGRKQNDWKAVEELTARLRLFDPSDPVRFDYALFGLGVFEGYR